jgi:hypothetical protein
MRFSLMEVSGSLGDLGTFVPLILAVTLTTGMDLGMILLLAGLANVATGLFFGLPVPVQPMKAIAAVAIADQLTGSDIAAAGLLMGVLMLVIGVTGWSERAERLIPRPVVRGIQLGVGIKLAVKGISFAIQPTVLRIDGLIVALASLGLVAAGLRWRRFPAALVLVAAGGVMAIWNIPNLAHLATLSLPSFVIPTIGISNWSNGFWQGALPQLPLTLLNSVVAVCALSGDLFPRRKIVPSAMATSVGLMNLVSCGLGGFPMCHGSGGLAGQYRFGARTGGSVVVLGVAKIAVGLLAGTSAVIVFRYFPMSILGVLLLVSGLGLAAPARDQKEMIPVVSMLVTAAGCLVINTGIGFVAGIGAYLALVRVWRLQSRS